MATPMHSIRIIHWDPQQQEQQRRVSTKESHEQMKRESAQIDRHWTKMTKHLFSFPHIRAYLLKKQLSNEPEALRRVSNRDTAVLLSTHIHPHPQVIDTVTDAMAKYFPIQQEMMQNSFANELPKHSRNLETLGKSFSQGGPFFMVQSRDADWFTSLWYAAASSEC